MKKKLYFILIIIAFILIFFILKTKIRNTGEVNLDSSENLEIVKLKINGMTCQSCALGVEYELKQVNGVANASVDYKSGTGIVSFDPNIVDAETIAKASSVYPAEIIS